jgi:hypothetical protein
VCGLLASRRPVGIALRVDDSFLEWKPGDDPWVRRGPIRGGHDVTIVGFDTIGLSKKIVFIVANSHGGGYGDHGYMLMSSEALESPESTYVCAVEIDPDRVPS